jgi:hypothetical protein
MNTKVLILEGTFYGTKRVTLDFLKASSLSRIRRIGSFEFCLYNGEYTRPNVVINSSEIKDLVEMTKIFKYYKDNCDWSDNHLTILNVLNAEEYVLFDGEFVAKKDNNKFLVNLLDSRDFVYARFVASNFIQAEKLAIAYKVYNYKLEYKTITL